MFFFFLEENKFCAYSYLIIGFIMQCVVEIYSNVDTKEAI